MLLRFRGHASNNFTRTLRLHILQEQERVRKEFSGAISADLLGGSFALKVYLVRPVAKLRAQWAGAFCIAAGKAYSTERQNATGGSSKTASESRLKPFIAAPGVDVQAVTAADLKEEQMDALVIFLGGKRW